MEHIFVACFQMFAYFNKHFFPNDGDAKPTQFFTKSSVKNLLVLAINLWFML